MLSQQYLPKRLFFPLWIVLAFLPTSTDPCYKLDVYVPQLLIHILKSNPYCDGLPVVFEIEVGPGKAVNVVMSVMWFEPTCGMCCFNLCVSICKLCMCVYET